MSKILSLVFSALIVLVFFLSLTTPTRAIVDPLASPNNKFGIHIISPTESEASSAASLVNSSGGDWGYVTVLIEDKDRNRDKWQKFFDFLREKHLIPLVRIATHTEKDYWIRPAEDDAKEWADFLNQLNWPTKNRYIIIYNEPNHAKEWGNSVDAAGYAKILSQTIDTLKSTHEDFFVLNAGLDASTPNELPNYQDELSFLKSMKTAVPDVFDKLDGWVSHSYPNPGFVGLPNDYGKGTVRTYLWEKQILRDLDVTKKLPIFITETGWKHSEGVTVDRRFPSTDTVAEYYKTAFETAWNYEDIVTVTPFLLDYQKDPFDRFSFKKITSALNLKTTSNPPEALTDFHEHYYTIQNLTKKIGLPIRENISQLSKGTIYQSMVARERYQIPLTFKNTGQTIWGKEHKIKLLAYADKQFDIKPLELPEGQTVKPGEEYTFLLDFETPAEGTYKITANLYANEQAFKNPPLEFPTEVKAPAQFVIKTKLKWKDSSQDDDYLLEILNTLGSQAKGIVIKQNNQSDLTGAPHVTPGEKVTFTLTKQNYKPKTITHTVASGTNQLDFGELEPNFPSILLNPLALWDILPFS